LRTSPITARNRVGNAFEHALSAQRVLAHHGQHGVEAVEEEVRADARLQCLEACFGHRRRERPCTQFEVVLDHHAGDQRHRQWHQHAPALQFGRDAAEHGQRRAGDRHRHQPGDRALRVQGQWRHAAAQQAPQDQRQQRDRLHQRGRREHRGERIRE
jgi:hypothetical protein